MSPSFNILGIAGSLRKASYNRALLRAAESLLPIGATLTIFDLEGLPLFNQDLETTPSEKLIDFKKKIVEADAILFSTPEYNYSLPGVLKNAIDCASRPFGESVWTGKPVAIMGASTGLFGTVRAQGHLRQVFTFLDMIAVNQPEVMVHNANKAFDEQTRLVDKVSIKLIEELLLNLMHLAQQVKG